MDNKKVTDVLLERIKYFVNSIENGEYEPKGYEFTISFNYQGVKNLTITDSYFKN